jgi:nitroimidazol reductase NimA-like FMN-containing flavoprotein (pyridoxamine 5'-phosphate oxidase superfamily)
MDKFEITPNTDITRLPKRGAYDKETIYAILDEALFVTLAYSKDSVPFQIPTGHCRLGDYLYIHGSVGSGYMRGLASSPATVCLSVTLIDGLVLARSAFHHSVNYRSVVMFSKPELVSDTAEQNHALEAFTNKIQPGRWDDVRKPDAGEWKATMVLKFRIEEASAKIRTGGPKDDEEDYSLPIWAGVVPLTLERKPAIKDKLLRTDIPMPEYLEGASGVD